MALGAEVVDFIGADIVYHICDLLRIRQIAIVKKETGAWLVRVNINGIDPARVKGGGPAHQPVDFVSLGEQEFGKVRAILAGDPGDEGFLGSHVNRVYLL